MTVTERERLRKALEGKEGELMGALTYIATGAIGLLVGYLAGMAATENAVREGELSV